MSVTQSNLSDPHYGYDLVVAVTQASVNSTMTQYLAGLQAPVVTACYAYDANNKLVPIDYQTLISEAKGSDPFQVPDGSNTATDQDLINLTNANFAGAVRAEIGLPNLPLDSIPPIVTLGSGTSAPVLFNLLCAQFQIVGFQYGPRGSSTWINQSQPTGSGQPWYFSANVFLNNTTVDPNSSVPPAVQEQINKLMKDPTNAFTIQQLFLDLDTAILESSPQIEGIDAGWPVWALISSVFLNSYFGQLQQNGQPVLNYTFTVNAPQQATLELGAVSRECLPLMSNGQPITNPTPAQLDATTLAYLGSTSTTAPVPVPFTWNWVELDEVSQFSGVQAVRRDVFFAFLAGLLNSDIGQLCIDTNVSMTHSGEDFSVLYSSAQSQNPTSFVPVAAVAPPGPDGFTTLLTIGYNHTSHDDSTSSTDLVEIWGNFNYTLAGSVAVSGNQIRVQARAQAYMSFQHREVFVDYTDLSGQDYYDKTLTVLYTLQVNQNGTLQVLESDSLADNSVAWDFDPKGILGKFGFEDDVKGGLTDVENDLANVIDSAFTTYVQQLTDEINSYNSWVFPGNNAFAFSHVGFSGAQDLITQITYVVPN